MTFDPTLARAARCAVFLAGSNDLFWRAAICLVRLIQDHPFVDANKRTGVVAARVFLQLNGIRLSSGAADKRKLENRAVDTADRRSGEEAAAGLFRQWARAAPRSRRRRGRGEG